MSSTRFLRIPGAIGAAALVLAFAPALDAQNPAPPPEDVTEEQLEAFANAYLDIAEISEALEAQLAEVEDPQDAMQIQEQAQHEMVAAVETRGLSPEEYHLIGAALNEHEALRKEFIQVLTAVQAERATP